MLKLGSILKKGAEQDARARENRRLQQGTVVAIDLLAHTARVDAGCFDANGNRVYLEDVGFDPHVVPSVGDTVSLDYPHSSAQSVRILGTALASSNGQGTLQTIVAVQKDGAAVASEAAVNFQTGANATLTVADDPTHQRVNVKIDCSAVTVDKDGSLVGQQPAINFKTGDNQVLTVTNNAGSSRVDVEIDCRTQVQNNGAAVGTEKILNFIAGTGAALTLADSAGNSRVDVTVGVTNPLPGPGSNGQVLRVVSSAWAADDDTKQITVGFPATLAAGQKARLVCEYGFTIQGWHLIADVSGSLSMDIRRCTYAQYDGGSTHPAPGDSIVGGNGPALSSAIKNTDSTLSGWTTAMSAGDVLEFVVSSVTTCTFCTLTLKVRR